MDTREQYRELIKRIITDYAQYKPSYGDIKVEVIFDEERDHYQLMNVGWNKNQHIHGCVLHLEIENGKIWIHHDGTETGVANDLVQMGIPKDQIVLAFHAPSKRKFTDFAVA